MVSCLEEEVHVMKSTAKHAPGGNEHRGDIRISPLMTKCDFSSPCELFPSSPPPPSLSLHTGVMRQTLSSRQLSRPSSLLLEFHYERKRQHRPLSVVVHIIHSSPSIITFYSTPASLLPLSPLLAVAMRSLRRL